MQSSIKKRLWKWIKKLKGNHDFDFEKITLDQKHLQNCKLLRDRYLLLELLPKEGIIAEIGVADGKFSEEILKRALPKRLHLIDAWDTAHYNDLKSLNVAKKFEKQIESEVIKIHRGYSTARHIDFEDNYFDWIYIDTDHTYATTKEELNLFSKKVKKGGIIAGHDFCHGNWNAYIRYGVREAVYEFCAKENWEFIYLTMEIGGYFSFGIRKIS
jgi:hypothetical protein